MRVRVVGIPLWVTVFAGFIAILSTTIGILGLIDPTKVLGYFEGADRLAVTWAGRNAGLGLAMAIAFYLRNSAAYAAAFIGSVFREIGDLLSLLAGEFSIGGLIGIGVFLLLDVSAFVLSIRAALKSRTTGSE